MVRNTLLNRLRCTLPLLAVMLVLTGMPSSAVAQPNKSTVLYAVKGQDSLYMDIYSSVVPPKDLPAGVRAVAMAPRPAMIFIFGGGFFTGTRDNKQYADYFNHLAERGYVVFSIDYRLGLKNSKGGGMKELARMLEASINLAVEDLFSATLFILRNAATYAVDINRIAVSGSSAGAITSLQAEYYLSNRKNSRVLKALEKPNPLGGDIGKELAALPERFNYNGVISFAGAIINMGTKLEWQQKPAPIALFHGSSDPMVPFKRIWTPMGSFNGSKKIAKSLKAINSSYMFNIYEGENHSVAVSPMTWQLDKVDDFLENFCSGKETLQSTSETVWPEREKRSAAKMRKEQKKSMESYMKGNL